MGQLANTVRADIESAIKEKQTALQEAALAETLQAETIDITMPGKSKHWVVCTH